MAFLEESSYWIHSFDKYFAAEDANLCDVAAKIDPAPQRLDKFGLTFDLGRTNSINLRSKQ